MKQFVLAVLFVAMMSTLALAETASLRLIWTDTAIDESGFVIEQRKGDGSFVEIGRVGPNVTMFRAPPVTGAVGTRWCYAVRAYKTTIEGDLMSERAEGCYVMEVLPPSAPIMLRIERETSE